MYGCMSHNPIKELTQHICVIELKYLGNISISNAGVS